MMSEQEGRADRNKRFEETRKELDELRKKLPGFEQGDMEDVVQETLLHLHRLEERNGPASKALAKAIFYRRRVDSIRKILIRRGKEVPLLEDADLPAGEEDEESGDSEVDFIPLAISALCERDRYAVILVYFDRLPYSNVAQHLNVSVSAVKKIAQRARQRLKVEIEKLRLAS